MPLTARLGKDATVYSISGKDYLGKFTNFTLEVSQDVVEHHTPQDQWRMITPRRESLTITGDAYIEAAAGDAELHRDILPMHVRTPILVSGDLIDGGTFAASGYLTSVGSAVGDDPNTESFTFESTGTFNLA